MPDALIPPAASPQQAAAHFAGRLSVETDVSDVHAALAAGAAFTLVDARGAEAWQQGRLPGAVHLPAREVTQRAPAVVPAGRLVVTYCWGPGCNGATRAALAFAQLGYRVKEMIGGYEYWVREGFPVQTAAGLHTAPADGLTAVGAAPACGC